MKNLKTLFIIFVFSIIQITTRQSNNSVNNKTSSNITNTDNSSKSKAKTNKKEKEEEEGELSGLSIERYNKFIERLKSNNFEKIVFLTGAGASTAAGIPDFRSKDGIFQQILNKYQYRLSSPKDIFDILVFRDNPRYFYEFYKDFKLENYSPTLFHYFMGYINSKNKLQYVFTQNIDGLDLKSGIDKEKIIFAHGSFETAQCSKCKKAFNKTILREYLDKEKVLYCDECGAPVKPGIIFYGEQLPHEFFEKSTQIEEADLMILCGTSLLVTPFNSLPDKASKTAVRLIINKESFKKSRRIKPFGFNDEESNDIFFKGECDNAVKKIIKDVGWEKEFYDFVEKTKKEEETKVKN